MAAQLTKLGQMVVEMIGLFLSTNLLSLQPTLWVQELSIHASRASEYEEFFEDVDDMPPQSATEIYDAVAKVAGKSSMPAQLPVVRRNCRSTQAPARYKDSSPAAQTEAPVAVARPPKRKAAENLPLAESDTDDDCDSESQSDQESELPELESEDCETSETTITMMLVMQSRITPDCCASSRLVS